MPFRHRVAVLGLSLLALTLIVTACGGSASSPPATEAPSAEDGPPAGPSLEGVVSETEPPAGVPEEPPKEPFQGWLLHVEDGSPIAGALVVMCPIIDIENSVCIMDEGLSAVTDDTGLFSFDEIYVGSYVVLYDPTNSAATSDEFWQVYQYHRVRFGSQSGTGVSLEFSRVGYFGNVIIEEGKPARVEDGAIVYDGPPWLVYEFDANGEAIIITVPAEEEVIINAHVTADMLNR